MTTETITRPPTPSARQLGLQVLGAAALGTLLTVTVILPTEYGVDPTRFGALTGLNALSQPPEVVVETRFTAPPEIARAEPMPFRQDVITVPVGAFGRSLGATE